LREGAILVNRSLPILIMFEEEFRKPLIQDKNGLYITEAQMNFFLNRDDGPDKVKEVHPVFIKYYRNCCLYNLVYDMMEQDPDCALMYWDEEMETVSMSFPTDGSVAYELSKITFEAMSEDFGNED